MDFPWLDNNLHPITGPHRLKEVSQCGVVLLVHQQKIDG
jgi:hypothetical protein